MPTVTHITPLFLKPISFGDSMKKIDVELLKEHKHSGVKYPAGTVLTVSQADADFMIARKIARVVKPTKKTEDA